MTTVAEARVALVTAVSASDDVMAPPGCMVFSSGSDLAGLGGSNVEWRYRVTCYVGWHSDSADTEDDLAATVQAKLVILRAFAGWRVLSVGPSVVRSLAGGDHLTADITVSTPVTLT